MTIITVSVAGLLAFVADNPPASWLVTTLVVICTFLASLAVWFLKRMAKDFDEFPKMIKEEREERVVELKEERKSRAEGEKEEREARLLADQELLAAVGKVSGRVRVLEALDERRAS